MKINLIREETWISVSQDIIVCKFSQLKQLVCEWQIVLQPDD